LLAGVAMATCFAALVPLPSLRGPASGNFLAYFLLAALAYVVAVARLDRDRPSLSIIWAFALLFRLTLLFTSPPTLSDDVYRHIWDGRLANAGVSPYAYPVDSPLLDAFDSPQRALVNHNWMASPYLPSAQALSALVYRMAPDSPLAFQIAAVFFDLLTGWLVTAMLGRLGLPRRRALIYLWNPLVCVEFAHGAHIDALMMALTMMALLSWGTIRPGRGRSEWLSPVALAAATLTKALPGLLLPVLAWRWGWRRSLVYGILIAAFCLPFGLGAGWGLAGPLDGQGLFGAIRIYGTYWNYNSGLYHWLEVALSGYRTPGAVPPELVGWGPIRAARLIAGIGLGATLLVVGWQSRRLRPAAASASDSPTSFEERSTPPDTGDKKSLGRQPGGHRFWGFLILCPLGTPLRFVRNHIEENRELRLVRLALVPLAAYLLLTTTVHPWYVTLVVPFFPFLLPKAGEATETGRFLWPGLYFSLAVSFSYVTYWDPNAPREFNLVRLVQYLPLYLMLVWAVGSVFWDRRRGA
jgi:hypothetical protein